jgi:allantoicase
MSTKRKYSVTVIPDNDAEQFSPSACNCEKCKEIHLSQLDWETFVPKTKLQLRMKHVIAKLEKDILTNNNHNVDHIPERLG